MFQVDSYCLNSIAQSYVASEYPWHFGLYAYMEVPSLQVREGVDCDVGCLRQRRLHMPIAAFDNAIDRLQMAEKR